MSNWLLSDEFIEFSNKVSELHAEKKKLKAELKEFYEKTTTQIKELDKQAEVLNQEFETWKKDKSNARGEGHD